jgi:hypothetical protein
MVVAQQSPSTWLRKGGSFRGDYRSWVGDGSVCVVGVAVARVESKQNLIYLCSVRPSKEAQP